MTEGSFCLLPLARRSKEVGGFCLRSGPAYGSCVRGRAYGEPGARMSRCNNPPFPENQKIPKLEVNILIGKQVTFTVAN